ncbi:MAG: nucleoside deaminase, partial [Deinococcus sp.]|nr:nucleoside deaminase [Deinococcus sp.]
LGTFDLSGAEIYTSCEPCPMCLGAIYWARIGKIYYGCTAKDAAEIGFADQFIYDELEQPKEKRKLSSVQVEREACLEAFRAWEQSPGKVPY